MQQESSMTIEQLYETYYTPLYQRVLRIVRNTADAEDVTQDTFLKAMMALPTFDPSRGSMVGWLYTIAVRTAINHTRRAHVRTSACSLDALYVEPPDQAQSDPQMRYDDATKRDLAVLQQLPPRYREVLYLHGAGYSLKELAAHFGRSTRTMRTWLAEARVALHEQREVCA
jgi:RNA polymerase sigma-70 factor (ECF subfamily)